MRTPTRLLVYTGGSRMVCEHSGVWALFTENTEMYSGQQAPSPWQLYLLHPQILCARASLQDPLQSAFPCLCLATSSRGTYHNHQCDAFRRLSLLQAGDRAWVGAHLLSQEYGMPPLQYLLRMDENWDIDSFDLIFFLLPKESHFITNG